MGGAAGPRSARVDAGGIDGGGGGRDADGADADPTTVAAPADDEDLRRLTARPRRAGDAAGGGDGGLCGGAADTAGVGGAAGAGRLADVARGPDAVVTAGVHPGSGVWCLASGVGCVVAGAWSASGVWSTSLEGRSDRGDGGEGGRAVDTIDEDVDVGAEPLAGVVGGPGAVAADGAPAARGGRGGRSVPTEAQGSGAGGPAVRGARRRGRRRPLPANAPGGAVRRVALRGVGRDAQRQGTECTPDTRGSPHETVRGRGQRTAPQSGRRQHERKGTGSTAAAGARSDGDAGDGGDGGGGEDAVDTVASGVRAGSVEKTLPRCKGQRGMKCSAEGPRMDVVIRP